MQVRVWLVDQQHAALLGDHERHDQKHLQHAAAGRGNVEGGRVFISRAAVFAPQFGTTRRWHQGDAEHPGQGGVQCRPGILVLMSQHKQIAQNLTRTRLRQQVVNRLLVGQSPLLARQPGDGRDERRGESNVPQPHQHDWEVAPGPYLRQALRLETKLQHAHLSHAIDLNPDLERLVTLAVVPQQIERTQRYGTELRALQVLPRETVLARVVVGAEFLPPRQAQRPCRDGLQQGRLAGVVRPGQHHMPRHVERHVGETLEVLQRDLADHRHRIGFQFSASSASRLSTRAPPSARCRDGRSP